MHEGHFVVGEMTATIIASVSFCPSSPSFVLSSYGILYVTCFSAGIISIDGTTISPIASPSECPDATAIALWNDGNRLFGGCSNGVIEINSNTKQIRSIANSCNDAVAFSVSSSTGVTFVGCRSAGVLSIQPNAADATTLISSANCPSPRSLFAVGSLLYAACSTAVKVIDLRNGNTMTTLIDQCSGEAFTSADGIIFVACNNPGSIVSISGNSTTKITDCFNAQSIVNAASLDLLFASCSNQIITIDRRLSSVIPYITGSYGDLLYEENSGILYTGSLSVGVVAVSGTFVRNVLASPLNNCNMMRSLARSSANNLLYAACDGSGIIAINRNGAGSIVANLSECSSPLSLFYSETLRVTHAGCGNGVIEISSANRLRMIIDRTRCQDATSVVSSLDGKTIFSACLNGIVMMNATMIATIASAVACQTISPSPSSNRLYAACSSVGIIEITLDNLQMNIIVPTSSCREAYFVFASSSGKVYFTCKNGVMEWSPVGLRLLSTYSASISSILETSGIVYLGFSTTSGSGVTGLYSYLDGRTTLLTEFSTCPRSLFLIRSPSTGTLFSACGDQSTLTGRSRIVSVDVMSCLRGYGWSDDSQKCNPCLPGQYRSYAMQIDKEANVRYCTDCKPGTISIDRGASQCIDCPSGQFSSSPTKCSNCTPGYYSPSNGGSGCVPCGKGSYSSIRSSVCSPCSPGRYTSVDASPECISCSSGRYSDRGGLSKCDECPIGRISADGASQCQPCPEGSTTMKNASVVCIGCFVGTYHDRTTNQCENCPFGRYQNMTGQLECAACDIGYYQPTSSSPSPLCIKCPPGRFSSRLGLSICDECPVGSFSDRDGATLCSVCWVGTMNNANASVTCTECFIGTYYSMITKKCETCPVGRYQNRTGQSDCLPCPVGHYQSSPFSPSPSCLKCPPGRYSPSENSTDCEDCPIGRYSDLEGLSECPFCPEGSSTLRSRSVLCIGCSIGRYYQNATKRCEFCPVGRSRNNDDYQQQSECSLCGLGEYQPSNSYASPTCLRCPSGRYSNAQGRSACSFCPEGRYQKREGQSECIECAVGEYQPSNRSSSPECIPCGPGLYSNGNGTIECTPCPPGRYSPLDQGSTLCLPCDSGYFSSSPGSRKCSVCPVLTYQFFAGASHCESCAGLSGVNCEGGEIVSKAGFFLIRTGPNGSLAETVLCPSLTLCEGGTINNQCGGNRRKGEDNLLCGECKAGYVEWQGKCIVCKETNGGLLFLILFLFWLYVIFIHFSSRKADGMMNVFMYFIQTALIIAGSPFTWLSFINFLSLSPLEIGSSSDSDSAYCIVPMSGYQAIALGVVVSIIFFIFHSMNCIVHLIASKIIQRFSLSRPSNPNGVNNNGLPGTIVSRCTLLFSDWRLSPYIRSFVSLLLFSYSQVTSAVLRYLHCIDVKGERVVFTAPSVRCDDDEYRRWLPLVILLLIFYVIGLPIMIAVFLLHRHRMIRSLQRSSADEVLRIDDDSAVTPRPHSATEMGKDRFHLRWSIFYALYQPNTFYWHIIILVRRTVVISVFTYLYEHPNDRQMIIQFIHLLSLIAQLYFQPFIDRICNLSELFSLSSLVLIGLIMTGHPLPPYSIPQQTVISILILIPIAIFLATMMMKKFLKMQYSSVEAIGEERRWNGLFDFFFPNEMHKNIVAHHQAGRNTPEVNIRQTIDDHRNSNRMAMSPPSAVSEGLEMISLHPSPPPSDRHHHDHHPSVVPLSEERSSAFINNPAIALATDR